jgi:2-iminobutanoate/2-iminopropanoate deaminase
MLFVPGILGAIGRLAATQVQQVYENLKMALQGCGATFKDVVKMNSFIVNYNPEYLKILREVRVSYLDQQHPPANTTAGGQALSPGVLIEVEAIAVIR